MSYLGDHAIPVQNAYNAFFDTPLTTFDAGNPRLMLIEPFGYVLLAKASTHPFSDQQGY
jgi:hypothetical protein